MVNPERVIVISDLHMAAGGGRGIFSAGLALVEFIQHLSRQPQRLDLVILGDALDYLQIRPYLDFSRDGAVGKTSAIIEHNQDVFSALSTFLKADGRRVRWCIGNHDVELVFPEVRALLRAAIGADESKLELPTEALDADGGKLDYPLASGKKLRLVHGNKGDPWNEINYHEALAAAKSGAAFCYPPGSLLVAKVLNRLKDEDGFEHVDRLKPEKTVALPLTLALWPDRTRSYLKDVVPAFFQADLNQTRQRFKNALARIRRKPAAHFERASGEPPVAQGLDAADVLAEGLLSALTEKEQGQGSDDLAALLNLDAAAASLAAGLKAAIFDSFGQRVVSSLLRGAAESANQRGDLFSVDQADELDGLVQGAFKHDGVQVLVAGHTHLSRAVSYAGDCFYLNSGTWADLMRIPRYIQGKRFAQAARELRAYFTDPASAPAELRVFQRLTYVDVDLGEAGKRPFRASLCSWNPDRSASLHQFP